jgi:hypothetical protein
MTTIVLPLNPAERAGRLAHPARRRLRLADGKLERLARVPVFAQSRRTELMALGAVTDLVDVGAGTVLATGAALGRNWWMVLDGWLLAEGSVARAVPAGWSWVAPQLPASDGCLSARREATVLVAPVHRLASTLRQYPRLGSAVRATLVGGDV